MPLLSFPAMGSQILAALDAPEPAAGPALRATAQRFARWEQALSRFRPDSELSALNRSAGGWQPISPTLTAVLAQALRAAETTDGLVRPTLLSALVDAGYDRDFAALTQAVAEPRPRASAAPPGDDWRRIELDQERHRVNLPRGMRLDLGGVAKGWAADRAAHELGAIGPALVDAGGDIAVSGPRADGAPWPIGVADPHDGAAQLDLLMLAQGGVATSGRDHRRWRQGGSDQHHIIDPRTGAPAATDLLSVTVVAGSAAEAEAAAKAALILGSGEGAAWLAARPWLAALLVRADGLAIRTANLDPFRWAP